MRKTNIGGQGVLDGIMMRSEKKSALAVRKEDGTIGLEVWDNPSHESLIYRIPVVRGIFNFVGMLFNGTRVLLCSAELTGNDDEEYVPSAMEKKIAEKTGKKSEDVMMFFAVVVSLALSIGLFFLLPTLVANLFRNVITSPFVMNLIEGIIRIVIFLTYVFLISFMKEIKTVFRYHGAEHKTITCYEMELPLDAAHVKQQPRLHPRCGTSYLLLVMIISTLIYSLFPWVSNLLLRFLTKLLLLPLIAGVSYEVLKLLARYDNPLTIALRWPGMQLQRLTTREPDEDIINVAIVAFEAALGEKSEQELNDMMDRFSLRKEEESEVS